MTLLTKLACWLFVASVATWHCIVPQPTGVLREHCDCLEVNKLYDEHGREVFTQAIWIDVVDGIEQVVAWRLVKQPNQLPMRDWASGGYVCKWLDGETVREVRTNCVRETFLQYDPELIARETFPKEKRRELRRK